MEATPRANKPPHPPPQTHDLTVPGLVSPHETLTAGANADILTTMGVVASLRSRKQAGRPTGPASSFTSYQDASRTRSLSLALKGDPSTGVKRKAVRSCFLIHKLSKCLEGTAVSLAPTWERNAGRTGWRQNTFGMGERAGVDRGWMEGGIGDGIGMWIAVGAGNETGSGR